MNFKQVPKNITRREALKKVGFGAASASLLTYPMLNAFGIEEGYANKINKPVFIKSNPVHEDAFPYRAWAIMVTNDTEIFTRVVERAVMEAKKYNINRIEFHDFLYGHPTPEGFMDNVVRFENFSKLKGIDVWNYETRNFDPLDAKRLVTNEMLDVNVEHFRKCAKMVKDTGLKLNVWTHSFRDLPEEFYQLYGQELHPDNDFLYEAFGMMLDEFFSKIPEVDGITLTSLGETKSFNDMPATLPAEERMFRFYSTAHKVCLKHGRELILRDFGGGPDFWNVANRLPDDVIYMTKWMSSDWERVIHPMHDRLMMAKGHKFVVEWDLRGEYLGQGFYPYCDPRAVWQTLLNVKLFEPYGCIGRIHWTDWKGKQYEWDSVFDVPNGLNAHVFSKGISEISRFRNAKYLSGVQGEHLPFHWIREWIVENYGVGAWPALYEVLRETPLIVQRLSTCADRFHTDHSFMLSGISNSTFINARAMRDEAGRDYIIQSKESAAKRAIELREKVKKIDIKPIEKKNKLIRSFDIMSAFAQIHSIWNLLYVDAVEWKDAGAKNPEQFVQHYRKSIKATRRVTQELSGGMALMINERVDRQIDQFENWVMNGGKGEMKYW